MGYFRQMASTSFKVNDRGETLFYAPRFFFGARQAYVVASENDVELLKRKLAWSYRFVIAIVIPVTVVALRFLDGDSDIVLLLLAAALIGVLARLTIRYLVIGGIVRKLESSPERVGFRESLAIHAACFSWPASLFLGPFALLMAGLGIYLLFSGKPILGICVAVVLGLVGLQLTYVMVLKRRQAGERAPSSRS